MDGPDTAKFLDPDPQHLLLDWTMARKWRVYLTGAPGRAGKSSFDIWNSEECSDGCFTMPTTTQAQMSQ